MRAARARLECDFDRSRNNASLQRRHEGWDRQEAKGESTAFIKHESKHYGGDELGRGGGESGESGVHEGGSLGGKR